MQPTAIPPSSNGAFNAIKLIAALVAGFGIFFLVQKSEKDRAKQRETMKELDQTTREAQDEMKREMDQNGGISAGSAEKTLQKMRGQLDRMGEQGGSEGKAMKALSEVMAELQEKTAPYIALVKRIETDNPAEMRTVKDRADLAERKKFAQEFLRVNQEVLAFMNSMETRVRDKLQKSGVAEGEQENFITGFMKGYGRTLPSQRKVRKADATMGNAILSMAETLDAEWGKWRVKDGHLVFDDDAVAARYNGFVGQIQKAAEEQAAAQRELIDRQQKN